ncbi:unnamed protein product [marine sediment metagenome]|uniref:Uncharacterized protein n=1 Tax=marine sediment metagenome TaxID=412755 RepID=X0XSI1_9ZZZZ
MSNLDRPIYEHQAKRLLLLLKDYDGDLQVGDEIQIHKWLEPNTEARIAVADATVVDFTDLVD